MSGQLRRSQRKAAVRGNQQQVNTSTLSNTTTTTPAPHSTSNSASVSPSASVSSSSSAGSASSSSSSSSATAGTATGEKVDLNSARTFCVDLLRHLGVENGTSSNCGVSADVTSPSSYQSLISAAANAIQSNFNSHSNFRVIGLLSSTYDDRPRLELYHVGPSNDKDLTNAFIHSHYFSHFSERRYTKSGVDREGYARFLYNDDNGSRSRHGNYRVWDIQPFPYERAKSMKFLWEDYVEKKKNKKKNQNLKKKKFEQDDDEESEELEVNDDDYN